MSVASGRVTTNLAGTILTFTDTGTYGTLVSRTLTIKNANGVIIHVENMGSVLVYNFTITTDGYYTFDLSVVDNTGTYNAEVNYLAIGFYTVAYLNLMASSGCGCNSDLCNADTAELFLAAAQRFALAGIGLSAENNILAANVYINMP